MAELQEIDIPMKYIHDYELVVEVARDDFGIEVTAMLNKGYELAGTPFVNMEGEYCQAVVKSTLTEQKQMPLPITKEDMIEHHV